MWFTGLTTFILLFNRWFTPGIIKRINVLCGFIIILYGVKLFCSFIMRVIRAF
jgi:L-lysine exporter family protein LysE/ArgO